MKGGHDVQTLVFACPNSWLAKMAGRLDFLPWNEGKCLLSVE